MVDRPFLDFDGVENGQPFFHVLISAPEAEMDDRAASDRQMEAVSKFYTSDMQLTASQAHALLSYRNYGRLFADRAFQEASAGTRNLIAHFIAAIISNDDQVAKDVVAWADRNYWSNADRATVARTKHHRWVERELIDHLWRLHMQGADFPFDIPRL